MPLAILLLAVLIHAPVAQDPAASNTGRAVFQRDCAFCHGRDAGGGESGPDLTRSKLVGEDVAGNKIAPLLRAGVPDRGMPPFKLPDAEMEAVVKFIHTAKTTAESKPGARRGVDTADLQTGNAAAGKQYFEGAGGCASCHSPTGDLAHVAAKYRGLRLEQRMLYPRGAKAKITVTPRGGQSVNGTLAYQDEFTVALEDASGKYRSWAIEDVMYTVEDPLAAHVARFEKYTDSDIHNLMAYLQTLR
jgi:cytochrome c oxidase cbb3-type subunit 3